MDITITQLEIYEKMYKKYFIDRKYAVGISTAGAMYHPSNLMSFNWMPKNLYQWMEKHNFNTFNKFSFFVFTYKSILQPQTFTSNVKLVLYTNLFFTLKI